jgi:hypothetical protein
VKCGVKKKMFGETMLAQRFSIIASRNATGVQRANRFAAKDISSPETQSQENQNHLR